MTSQTRLRLLVALLTITAFVLAANTLFLLSSPKRDRETRTGLASFYDDDLEGEKTASGKRYNLNELVAAHPTYPAGTLVQVTNLENGRSVRVQIIDRGPSHQNRVEGVIIDLSRRAAQRLGFIKDGRVRVRTRVLKWGTSTMQGN